MSELERWHIWLIGGERVVIYFRRPISEQSYQLLVGLLEIARPALTYIKKKDTLGTKDIGPCGTIIMQNDFQEEAASE